VSGSKLEAKVVLIALLQGPVINCCLCKLNDDDDNNDDDDDI